MKVAVVGAGAVGAAAAYYLAKNKHISVTVFDEGTGQATKAAAGIISPWFSKRRNRAWYRLARLGADFYQDLTADLQADGYRTDFYQQTGVYVLRKDDSKLQELYDLALSRREEAPLIGKLALLSKAAAAKYFPGLQGFETLLYASGGARVDGAGLVKTLLEASQAEVIREKVSLELAGRQYRLGGQNFDAVILAAGAWLSSILAPLGYTLDLRPQKGQLRDYYFTGLETDPYPVVMPEGELDIIPFPAGQISVGATHENHKGFDLSVDRVLLDDFRVQAQNYLPHLKKASFFNQRVGIRAYTSDFSPFFGSVPNLENVYTASGLGSTGLTTGPLLGCQLARLLQGQELLLHPKDYAAENYIVKKH
ncbi:NAD(P)/FAD-dependent oxidoreductase [Streptococcus sp. H31]|uniref:NAD(P)/FAD-dependent oxidoreductase n=1 Tax=Streptococcus huangxiaojuni TaxID=3237239 RepID=UPI0034A39506